MKMIQELKTIKTLCNDELLAKAKLLVAQERQKTIEVIEHLQEIYDRRLHLEKGYRSLHEFLVHEMNYSDGAAHRRISAMRLVKDIPQAKESIKSGELSLTTASQVQGFFYTEKKSHQKTYSQNEKLELLANLKGASKQQCERQFAAISPNYQQKPKQITLDEDKELTALLEEYRRLALVAEGSPQSIVKSALKTAITHLKEKQNKTKQVKAKQVQAAPKASLAQTNVLLDAKPAASLEKLGTPAYETSRYIPQKLKQEIWRRDQGQCRYIHYATKRRCEATQQLEVDHIKPFALDGATTQTNLRLLCRAHNQMLAKQTYGDRAHYGKTESSLNKTQCLIAVTRVSS